MYPRSVDTGTATVMLRSSSDPRMCIVGWIDEHVHYTGHFKDDYHYTYSWCAFNNRDSGEPDSPWQWSDEHTHISGDIVQSHGEYVDFPSAIIHMMAALAAWNQYGFRIEAVSDKSMPRWFKD